MIFIVIAIAVFAVMMWTLHQASKRLTPAPRRRLDLARRNFEKIKATVRLQNFVEAA